MFHIALFEPEIPPNTGNIIRLCVNTGAKLHLIEPLGFSLDDAKLKRAGLDYHEFANISIHKDFTSFVEETAIRNLFACSTKGQNLYTQVNYEKNDALLFGPESRGLPKEILENNLVTKVVKLPMQPHSRSLNLSNAVAIFLFEAWRQNGFS